MNNLLADVSTLTTIPVKNLNQLMDKFIYCIIDIVNENSLKGENTSEIDLYFGILTIQHTVINEKHQLKYKFIPAPKLNKQFSDLFEKKLNSLNIALEQSLANKIIHTYKDLV